MGPHSPSQPRPGGPARGIRLRSEPQFQFKGQLQLQLHLKLQLQHCARQARGWQALSSRTALSGRTLLLLDTFPRTETQSCLPRTRLLSLSPFLFLSSLLSDARPADLGPCLNCALPFAAIAVPVMSSRSYDRRDHRIRDDGKVGSIGHEGASASGSLVSSHARDSRRLEHDNGRYNGGHGRRSRSPADRARRRAGGEGKYYETRDGQERRRGGWPKEDAASRSSVRRDESSMDMYVTVGGKRPDSSIARRPNGDADLKQR